MEKVWIIVSYEDYETNMERTPEIHGVFKDKEKANAAFEELKNKFRPNLNDEVDENEGEYFYEIIDRFDNSFVTLALKEHEII